MKYSPLTVVKFKKHAMPFQRAWVLLGTSLLGFVAARDGGKPGFGTTIHSLAKNNLGEGKLVRNICLAKSRVCKRNIVVHELFSGLLSAS